MKVQLENVKPKEIETALSLLAVFCSFAVCRIFIRHKAVSAIFASALMMPALRIDAIHARHQCTQIFHRRKASA